MPTEDKYRPLDLSRNEIRLVSFETTTENGLLHLKLHHESLDDWKPSYLSFLNENSPSVKRTQFAEVWSEHFDLTLATPEHEICDTLTRFSWGDYICLSYTRSDCVEDKATVFLDGTATAVSKQVEVALSKLSMSFECRVGMKVWVDALCVNNADMTDRQAHNLRSIDIFARAFAVTVWTNNDNRLDVLRLSPQYERLQLCETILRRYGRITLEELLGVSDRSWGSAEDEDEGLKKLVDNVDELTFDNDQMADLSDEDDFGFSQLHIYDLVCVELWQLLRWEYWSQDWILLELTMCPTTSTIHCEGSEIYLSTIQVVSSILLANSGRSSNRGNWQDLKPKLDLLVFMNTWSARNFVLEDGSLMAREVKGPGMRIKEAFLSPTNKFKSNEKSSPQV